MSDPKYIGPYSAETYDKMYGTGALFTFPSISFDPNGSGIVAKDWKPKPPADTPKKEINIMHLAIGFVALVAIVFLIIKFK